MSEYEIRRASIDDAVAQVEFNLHLAKETEDKDLDPATLRAGVERILTDASRGFYVVGVNADGQVIGATMVTKEWSDWRNADIWWIQSVYVRTEFRRQGVFRKLFDHIRTLGEKEEVCGFRLYVERENEVAQDTYANLGMSETVYKMFEMMTG